MAVLFRRSLAALSNSTETIFKQARHSASFGPPTLHHTTTLEEEVNYESVSPQELKQEHHKPIELDTPTVIPTKRVGESKFRRFPKFTKKATVGGDSEGLEAESIGTNVRDAMQVFAKKKIKYKPNKFIKAPSKQPCDIKETLISADGEFIYTELPNDNPIVGLLKDKAKKILVLLEGKRLIKEALLAKCHLKSLIFSRKNDIEELKPYLPKTEAKLYKAPYKEICMWSNLATSPGLMGFFEIPEVDKYVPPSNALPITIVCDNVKEPGNLAAILRTATGVGVERVILTKGCVDLWDTKVLRSAFGSHFRVQIMNNMEWSDVKCYVSDKGSSIFVASNSDGDTKESTTSKSSLCEEDGIDKMGIKLRLPPVVPYHEISYGDVRSLVLIIGGETEGISDHSYKLVEELGGCCLNVPLMNEIESLNAGTALGVIAFEMRRQIEEALLKRKGRIEVTNAS